MSLGSGPRGYADWQRVENWDGPVLAEVEAARVSATESVELGRWECSRYARTLISLQNTGRAGCQLTLTWYAAIQGGTPIGEYHTTFHEEMGAPLVLLIPNLGPFVAVSITYIPAGEETHTTVGYRVMQSNREVSSIAPLQGTVANAQEYERTAEETIYIYPSQQNVGQLHIFLANHTPNIAGMQLQALFKDGTWKTLAGQAVAANTEASEDWPAPNLAWRLALTLKGGRVYFAATVYPALGA